MNKKVTFAPQYKILKWTPNKDYEIEKTWREIIDMRSKECIEEELIHQHETDYGNKREICSKRMACRDMVQDVSNPFMIKNNYLDDLTNQDMYLRPQDSNSKTSNKYLKTE